MGVNLQDIFHSVLSQVVFIVPILCCTTRSSTFILSSTSMAHSLQCEEHTWSNIPVIVFYSPLMEAKQEKEAERLASLGIMGEQFRTHLKPLNTTVLCCLSGFRGDLNWDPMIMTEDNYSYDW